METTDLIHSLARNASPVKRLRVPLLRATGWLLLAASIMTLMTLGHGLRPQFFERMHDPIFSTNIISSSLTGFLAAISVCFASLPDRSRGWLFLPVPSLVLWLSTIGYQCFAGWIPLPPGAITVEAASSCFATLILTSLPLSLSMLVMLRHTMTLNPLPILLTGGLAVSAVTASSLAMFHPLDATVMVVVWNLGTMALILGLSAAYRRKMA